MKIRYSISNLRSLRETPYIELKPITVLVGRNSAGKSTFLRSFPLLRQSVEVRSSAPILWFGERVDFCDFRTAVHNRLEKNTIKFGFEIEDLEIRQDNFWHLENDYFGPLFRRRSKKLIKNSRIEFEIASHKSETVRRSIKIYDNEHNSTLLIELDKTGTKLSTLKLNEHDLTDEFAKTEIRFQNSHIFSPVEFARQLKGGNQNYTQYLSTDAIVFLKIRSIIKSNIKRKISDDSLLEATNKLMTAEELSSENLERFSRSSKTKTISRFFNEMQNDSRISDKIIDLWSVHSMLNVLSEVCNSLSTTFRSVKYIGPARAQSERYYRLQELQVSEIDRDGSNLPIFLNSLPKSELRKFSNWVNQLFGYHIEISPSQGHVSINLVRSGHKVNIADTGYGVSQLLPVLAQVWWSTRDMNQRQNRSGSRTTLAPLVIEQPELHLHPAHQAKLADVFAESAKNCQSGGNREVPFFLIETHSESLINRLGELIENKQLSHDDVQIVVFENSDELKDTSIASIASFSNDGILVGWPYGFFNYDSA